MFPLQSMQWPSRAPGALETPFLLIRSLEIFTLRTGSLIICVFQWLGSMKPQMIKQGILSWTSAVCNGKDLHLLTQQISLCRKNSSILTVCVGNSSCILYHFCHVKIRSVVESVTKYWDIMKNAIWKKCLTHLIKKSEIWISLCKSSICDCLEQTGRKGKAFMWNVDENNSRRITVNTVEKCWWKQIKFLL